METNSIACSTVTKVFSTAEVDPITVTVTKWSNSDQPENTVPSLTAEKVVTSTYIETSFITQTSTAKFTETLPATITTATVTQTSIEVCKSSEIFRRLIMYNF